MIGERQMPELIQDKEEVYVIHAVVERVEERHTNIHVRGAGKDAVFQRVSDGWYVLMRNWPSAIWFGRDQPKFAANEHVKITFKRV